MRTFLSSEVGLISVPGSSLKYGDDIEWRNGQWILDRNDPCGPAIERLEMYREALEWTMRHVLNMKRVIMHRIFRMSRAEITQHLGVTQNNEPMMLTVNFSYENDDHLSPSVILWCEKANKPYITHEVARIPLPSEGIESNGDAGYILAANAIPSRLKDSRMQTAARTGLMRCVREDEPPPNLND